MNLVSTILLFAGTAVVETVGCYLPDLGLCQGKPPSLVVPAASSLALFAWPLWFPPGRSDYLAVALCLAGRGGIMLTHRI